MKDDSVGCLMKSLLREAQLVNASRWNNHNTWFSTGDEMSSVIIASD